MAKGVAALAFLSVPVFALSQHFMDGREVSIMTFRRISIALVMLMPPAMSNVAFDLGGAIRGFVGGAVSAIGGPVGTVGGVTGQLLNARSDVAGGAIGLPGQLAFGPGIKDWETANCRTVDKLGATLNGYIDKLDKTLNAKITSVTVY